MDNIEKYYNELYSEKVTLQSLAKNILVEGYQSVNFKKFNNLVVCEATYKENEDVTIYKYSFMDEKLFLLEKVYKEQVVIIYDRNKQIENLKSKLVSLSQKYA